MQRGEGRRGEESVDKYYVNSVSALATTVISVGG